MLVGLFCRVFILRGIVEQIEAVCRRKRRRRRRHHHLGKGRERAVVIVAVVVAEAREREGGQRDDAVEHHKRPVLCFSAGAQVTVDW